MYQVYYTSPNEPESIESEKGRHNPPFDAFASGKYCFMGCTFERIPVLPVPAFHEEPGISVVLRPGMVAFGPCCHRTSPRESRSLYRPDRLRPSYRSPNTNALLPGQVLGAQIDKPGAQLPGVLHTAVNDLPPQPAAARSAAPGRQDRHSPHPPAAACSRCPAPRQGPVPCRRRRTGGWRAYRESGFPPPARWPAG